MTVRIGRDSLENDEEDDVGVVWARYRQVVVMVMVRLY